MISALRYIEKNNLLKPKQKIGVAVSGGIDSMCLLHFLNSQAKKFDIEIVAINIDHQIRDNSASDSKFVENYCKSNNIKFNHFKVNAIEYSKSNKISLEEGARICRYGVFQTLLDRKIVDKIAIAHHRQDQVETILLNLLRGSGLKGVSGMECDSNGYLRPFLSSDKTEIIGYAQENDIAYVEDETNQNSDYSRNYLRNIIIPQLKEHWSNFENNIINFSKICKQDDQYINSLISYDNLVYEDNAVKIPLNMFLLNNSVTFRLIRKALEYLHSLKDIEQKHLLLIKNLAVQSANGTKINLPNGLGATKEYDYLTLYTKKLKQNLTTFDFRLGKQTILGNAVEIKKLSKVDDLKSERTLFIDYDKLDKKAIWRTKRTGDVFNKFSGGTKKLKDYFIDKKIPSRLRNQIPLLCIDNQVLVILGVEISEKLKVDQNSKHICSIKF